MSHCEILFHWTSGALGTVWLIPASELEGVARESATHLIIVASAKETSNDRFSPYRMKNLGEVSARILAPKTPQ